MWSRSVDAGLIPLALLRHRYRDAGLALSVGAPVTGIAEPVNAGTYVHELGTRR
jgi:hypothetical protein